MKSPIISVPVSALALALLGATSPSPPAYAAVGCPDTNEFSFGTGTATLPNGQSIVNLENAWFWFPNDESGGMPSAVVHGNHRKCGKIEAYIYIGDTPQDRVWFAVPLNPNIVSPNVAQAGCTAMLETTNDVYYFGYNDGGDWPFYQEVHGQGSWSDGNQIWKAFYIYGGGNLNTRSTYTVNLLCPPNTPGQQ